MKANKTGISNGLKIAIFSDNFYPELSGITDSIMAQAVALEKLGHQVAFYAPKYAKKNYKIAGLAAAELKFSGRIEVHRFFSLPFPSPTKQSRLVIPAVWRSWQIKKFNPDVIHSHLFFGVGLEGLLAAKILGRPIIGTNHTRLKEFLKNGQLKSNWAVELLIGYMNWYYNSCDFVTAPSQAFLDEMKVNGLKKISRSIANPLNAEIFNNAKKINKEEIRKKYGLSSRVMIYAGRLADEKNIDVIIKAIVIARQTYPNINLALAGHGQAEPRLKELSKKLGLENNVIFLGTLNHHDLADLYRAADAFVIASTSEVQSMTVIQSMACGLPVIAVDYGSLRELVSSDNGLLFKTGDERDLAEKIIKVLSSQALKDSLSLKGIDFSVKFSSSNIAKEWEGLYNEVIKNYKDKA